LSIKNPKAPNRVKNKVGGCFKNGKEVKKLLPPLPSIEKYRVLL